MCRPLLAMVLLSWSTHAFAEEPPVQALRDRALRRAAVAHLIAAGPSVAADVAGLLSDPDAETRATALFVLRSVRAPELTPDVAAVLAGDESEHVRAAAAETLGALGDPRAVPGLIAALDDPDRTVRVNAIASLGRIDSAEGADALRAVIAGTAGEGEMETAFVAAGHRRLYDLADDFEAVVRDRERPPRLRSAALVALGAMGAPEAAPAILGALRDEVADVRFNALSAVDDMRLTTAAEAVEAVLHDGAEEQFVRLRAGWTLARLSPAEAARALTTEAGGSDEFMSMHAVVILASFDRESARDLAAAVRAKTKDAFVAATMEKILRGEPLPWGQR